MKLSFVATALNEEKTIDSLVLSILSQTKKPDEIIIVDGGSSDRTIAEIKNLASIPFSTRSIRGGRRNGQKSKIKSSIKFKIIVKKGNRSVGRNKGIKQTKGDIVVISDAGCILHKDWIKNIIKPFSDPKVDVVAGYYDAKPQTIFQKCLVPYVFVMPDKVDPTTFLPASRSMAFRKKIWKQVGGFNERYSHNEDYVFAKKLKKYNMKIFFQKDAIVYWIPRRNLKEAFIMFFRFALGDAQAHIYRPKVILIFLRYCVFLFLIGISIIYPQFLIILTVLLATYLFWSIVKNYNYVRHMQALYYLPLLQITSDIAVLLGTIAEVFKRFKIL